MRTRAPDSGDSSSDETASTGGDESDEGLTPGRHIGEDGAPIALGGRQISKDDNLTPEARKEIKENEIKLEELRRENKRRGDNLAYLMSPQELDTRLRQLNLDLMVPRPEQIVVLQEQREPAPQSPMVGTEPIRTASR